MRGDVRPVSKAFIADARGNFAIIFAFMAPIVLVGLAAALDYSNAVTEQQRTQAATDAAAVATADGIAAQIMGGSNWTAAQAQAIGSSYFSADAPATMITAEKSFNATVSVTGNVVTATVNYAGTPSGLLGNVLNMATNSISVTSVASATIGGASSSSSSSGGSNTSSGSGTNSSSSACTSSSGTSTASQHQCGTDQDDSDFTSSCDTSHATWYNLLSDQNFQINANCDGDGQRQGYYQFAILAGTHEIDLSPSISVQNQGQGQDQNQQDGWSQNDGGWQGQGQGDGGGRHQHNWQGDVTIDGQTYPALPGTHTYVNDQSCGVKVTVVVGDGAHTCSAANYVQVSTPNYSMTIAYDGADDENDNQSFGYPSVRVTAANPGACATPGGLWGSRIAGQDDSSGNGGSCHGASNYGVSCSNQKHQEFSQTCTQTAQNTCSTIASVIRN